MSYVCDLTAEYARSLFDYDEETGLLVWRQRTDVRKEWNTRHAGRIAGSLDSKGYLYARINKKAYRLHRLIWLIVTGEWPKSEVDHKDTNRVNNKWLNLRAATSGQNKWNAGMRADNTSGLKGVSWSATVRKWQSQMCKNNERRHLGFFDCPAAAHLKYVVEADKHFGEFARSN